MRICFRCQTSRGVVGVGVGVAHLSEATRERLAAASHHQQQQQQQQQQQHMSYIESPTMYQSQQPHSIANVQMKRNPLNMYTEVPVSIPYHSRDPQYFHPLWLSICSYILIQIFWGWISELFVVLISVSLPVLLPEHCWFAIHTNSLICNQKVDVGIGCTNSVTSVQRIKLLIWRRV